MLAIPLAVVIQTRPPKDQKGRVLAAMSWFHWIGVLMSAAFYFVCVQIRQQFHWPPSVVFSAIAVPLVIIGLLLPNQTMASRRQEN
jgi:hypothetical protein